MQGYVSAWSVTGGLRLRQKARFICGLGLDESKCRSFLLQFLLPRHMPAKCNVALILLLALQYESFELGSEPTVELIEGVDGPIKPR